MIRFTNPRLEATFDDWPMGGTKRGSCTFTVEHNAKRGWRFVRQTTFNGRTAKPKTATYGGKAAIVDGEDGRTYLIQFAGQFDFIKISAHDFKDAHADKIERESGVFPESSPEDYATLAKLIEQANE